MTIANTISGSIELVQQGSGALTLTGSSNTYYDGTTINAGSLWFTSGALSLANSITFAGNGTLGWSGSGNATDISNYLVIDSNVIATVDVGENNVTFATGIYSSGSITAAGSGSLTIQGYWYLNDLTVGNDPPSKSAAR